MSTEDHIEVCPICIEKLNFRNKKIFTTCCNHRFHEGCIEKIKEVLETTTLPSGEEIEEYVFPCPCCRKPIDPTIKQQIKTRRESLKRIAKKIRSYSNIYYTQMQYQNDIVRKLEASLREAKQRRKVVQEELTNGNKYLKKCQNDLKIELANLLEETKKRKTEQQDKSTLWEALKKKKK